MKKELNIKNYECMLDDLCHEYCRNDVECILKKFLVSLHPSPRLLLQLKCMEKFKWEINQNQKEDIGWNETIDRWNEEGYAEMFAKIYEENDDPSYKKIYSQIKNEIKNKNN